MNVEDDGRNDFCGIINCQHGARVRKIEIEPLNAGLILGDVKYHFVDIFACFIRVRFQAHHSGTMAFESGGCAQQAEM